MTKRKANSEPPNKQRHKKQAAFEQQSTKSETPAAKAYRLKRDRKLAQNPSDTSRSEQEADDVYAFPAELPSPPPSTKQASPTVPNIDPAQDDDGPNARIDEELAHLTSTVPSKVLDHDTLLNILCAFHDVDLTELALDALMQKAAKAARPGDEFGILFLRKFVSKLANMPIEDGWLAKVIDILQQNLESRCDRVKCQIQSLGKLPLPEHEQVEAQATMTSPDDDAKLCENIIAQEIFDIVKALAATAESSSHDEGHQIEHETRTHSEQSDRKTKDTQRSSLQPPPAQSNSTQSLLMPCNESEKAKAKAKANDDITTAHVSDNSMDTVYDLFVRSATDANCFGTQEYGKASKTYRKRIRKVWGQLEPEQKAAWVKLFNARPDDIPLNVKGEGLLWSQELLPKLLPGEYKRKQKS